MFRIFTFQHRLTASQVCSASFRCSIPAGSYTSSNSRDIKKNPTQGEVFLYVMEMAGIEPTCKEKYVHDSTSVDSSIVFKNTSSKMNRSWCVPSPNLRRVSDEARQCLKVYAQRIYSSSTSVDGWLTRKREPAQVLLDSHLNFYGGFKSHHSFARTYLYRFPCLSRSSPVR